MEDNSRVFDMTLRDWFAGLALQAMIAKSPLLSTGASAAGVDDNADYLDHDLIRKAKADGAYGYADAMLRRRQSSAPTSTAKPCSPILLAACKDVVTMCPSEDACDPAFWPVVLQCRAAIAKVEART